MPSPADGGTARREDINGYVTIESNPISRAGVFQYLGRSIDATAEPDRIYNVYRPAESLSEPEALESFKLMPIIDDHTMLGPQEKGLTPAEQKGTHGTTGEAVFYEPQTQTLFANLRMFSQSILDKIRAGKIDLSMGYRCAYKKISGFFEGMPYDYIQTNIRGNHLALVDEARCNVAVLDHRFTYDARDVIQTGDSKMADQNKGDEGKEKTIDLAEVHKYMKDNAPLWNELKDMMGEKKDGEGKDTDISPSGDIAGDEDEKKKAEDKAKDEAEAEKKKAEDKAKDESEKKEDKGMDAKEVTRIATAAAREAVKGAPTFADFAKEAAARDDLYTRLTPLTGAFDHKEKTLAQVAEYGVQKLGLKAPKGQEIVAIDSYLAGRKQNTTGFALDSKTVKKNKVNDKIAAHISA